MRQLPLEIEPPRRASTLSVAKLPTNTTTHRHAVHRWFNFIAGFSPEFVELHLPRKADAVVLDPFGGCGTTLVVAQAHGLRSIGFEPHPFFARIARAKTGAVVTAARLATIHEAMVEGTQSPSNLSSLSESAGLFLAKLFDPEPLRQVMGAREAIDRAGLGQDDLAFLMLSRVLDMCSKAQTDGIYKAPTSAKRAASPSEAIASVVEQVRSDLDARDVPDASAVLHQQTSENMAPVKTRSVDVAITSPPYLNNFDFAEMTRMYLYFWGICGSWREITDLVRRQLIVNTTTALSGHRDIQAAYRTQVSDSLLPELDSLVHQLAGERKQRAGKKEYDLLVFPYFAQMSRVLAETLRCLRANGTAHVVVADAAFYGIHVSTPQILAQAMSDMGFRNVKCEKMRDRGHRWVLSKRDGSPTGLGEYHLTGSRGPTA